MLNSMRSPELTVKISLNKSGHNELDSTNATESLASIRESEGNGGLPEKTAAVIAGIDEEVNTKCKQDHGTAIVVDDSMPSPLTRTTSGNVNEHFLSEKSNLSALLMMLL